MKTQTDFFQANAVDGYPTDAQMMQMLNLPEGDSAQAQISLPDAEPAPEPTPAVEVTAVEPEPKPVILAKDGVHTIPFEKLAEAREAEQHWKQVALDAQAKLAAASKPAPVEQVPAAAPEVEDASLFGDFSEDGIAKGVKAIVAKTTAALQAEFDAKLTAALAPLQAKQAQTAEEAHFAAIEAVHPDVDSVAQSAEFKAWIDAQPSFVRDGYKAVITQGTAEQVIEALNTYKAAAEKPAPTPMKTSVEAAAQAAIAKAQLKPPMSLSDIPASSWALPHTLDGRSNAFSARPDSIAKANTEKREAIDRPKAPIEVPVVTTQEAWFRVIRSRFCGFVKAVVDSKEGRAFALDAARKLIL